MTHDIVTPRHFQAAIVASALKMYIKTGMRANRAYTPKSMMRTATAITGQSFKPRDYEGAAMALRRYAGIEPDEA